MKIQSSKQLRNSDVVEKIARRNNLEIVRGKGSHEKIRDPKTGNHVEIVQCKEMSRGVADKVFNFFKVIGVIILLLGIIDISLILAGVITVVW